MSAKIPHDARENGLEEDFDPLGERENLDPSDTERRLREETESILHNEWEHGPGKDDRDPLGAAHL